MDPNSIVQIISTVGFPIVCCGALMYYVKYIIDTNREQLNSIMEKHQKEESELTAALNNNTLVMQKLIDRLDKGEVNDD